jgi:hypothetical protein
MAIVKRYDKPEIKPLSKRKNRRENKFGATERPFKLEVENRFLILLVYYHLYITYGGLSL